ncbi:MAG: MetS family NSS transporter small subunit [Acidobacteria bacterium]|nr:MetS family NSS transporter small subunit [Acidobacteriota bacterium]
MSGSAVVMMILVCGFVWGGFVYLLVRAVRSEAGKS